MQYIYTAVFTPIENNQGFFARVPDLPGCITTGATLSDAIDQITDAMNGWLVVAEDESLDINLPTPQTELPANPGDSFAYIKADTILYRAATDNRAVRKNVSLPAWMLNMAEKKHINCSKILQDALMNILS